MAQQVPSDLDNGYRQRREALADALKSNQPNPFGLPALKDDPGGWPSGDEDLPRQTKEG
jgi:hypothetical protein